MSYNRPVSYLFDSFSFHINQTNILWDTARVKVMSEVEGHGLILYPVSSLSFSFRIGPTIFWDMAKLVFDLEKTHLLKVQFPTIFHRNLNK